MEENASARLANYGTWHRRSPLIDGAIPEHLPTRCRLQNVTFGFTYSKVSTMRHVSTSRNTAEVVPRRRRDRRKLDSSSSRRRRERRRLDFSTLHPDQNLDEYEVAEFLRISRSNLRNKLYPSSPYYDPSFPEPHEMRGEAKLGRAVRWRAGAIIEWNRARPPARTR